MVNLQLQADVKTTLETLLSPRLLQMLNVLNLPYLELIEHVNKEAEENVMLEVERQDEYVEFLRYLTSDGRIKKDADFKDLPGLENFSRVEKTLEQHLLDQLEIEDLSASHLSIAKTLIGHLDANGYIQDYPRHREEIMTRSGVSRPTVDKVLKIIQGLEPEGVGARDLKECLKIQIEAYNFDNEQLQELLGNAVDKHLDDLADKNYAAVAAALGIPESGVEHLAGFIKENLNPYPGASFGGEAQQVLPSYAVEITDEGTFKVVNLEERYGPTLRISKSYLKMLDDPKTDEKTKNFLKEKFRRAKHLMEDFGKRSETLSRIVRKIVERQEPFLRQGILWLIPLTQKSLAAEFGLHPSTISRAVAAKYIQTPQGLFQLKSLCPLGPKGMTAVRLKAMLAEIIKDEDKTAPLTDQALTARLKERGARIDRRTVAYYRKELKIAPAGDRAKG
ncbi:RNA polymerase sigma-54 factor [candidate division WOR-1 bacterium RIFOXYA12_FULL_52_29]|uniref:RNA polymerase sigma-54 factor n=1 Tax=candidate division WOR-1 bacterium RIFOXYC12_FULL_54_18 TaxID=1802584 RepID=A0A1F4T9B3_UNCSA|nr:MAG: RNA polymerase sigma-54 factor [candidate division WOR-1 bacterium RIFOXYA2_FULL_51_19]OGC18196.1 MAG: RNA polymerase sigma-54 factor [candidate division WOR-1 bacterium RIFOXYA12_FULL_52_29]OGC27051.1 MAG: RNA polymerase sigma-54 factor [candidate division WOR-1 bacterium RIFOXYB2_FULL_45_9]OGC28613.1 MAG: RNA polymerase sigma-54 factor [candidate division WOR-1 bacterium RIFOXYC12_FULL_54_18]OGC30932.1 MAG: RNA polymerase sigma-54 factor [candidate division WOR-1 bacterium RIFOXYB12_F